jgi:hypothetical protein
LFTILGQNFDRALKSFRQETGIPDKVHWNHNPADFTDDQGTRSRIGLKLGQSKERHEKEKLQFAFQKNVNFLTRVFRVDQINSDWLISLLCFTCCQYTIKA